MNGGSVVKSAGRRLVSMVGGSHAEALVHAGWHDLLRSVGRFVPPEDTLTQAVLAAAAARSRTVVDVGANVGVYTRFFCSNVPVSASVYAFEPNPAVARLLRRNLRKFSNVECFELALGERDGSACLDIPTDAAGNRISGLGRLVPVEKDADIIEVRSLDALMDAEIVEPCAPALIKIDVEGGEAAVLKGASNFMRLAQPIVYFECESDRGPEFDRGAAQVWESLYEQDAVVLKRSSEGFSECDGPVGGVSNYLAVPHGLLHRSGTSISGSDLVGSLEVPSQRR